jgi:methyltransferase (TIGR00027 family)
MAVMGSSRPSLTARWVASNRARLDDSRPTLASGDAEAERRLYAGLSLRVLSLPGMTPTGALRRTAFFDDETVAAMGRGVRQIVILGAGYDGRPLRFGPAATWIEVDRPGTQADKRRRLSRLGVDLGHLRFAPVDLLVDDLDAALATAGHDVTLPTLFLCEGLFAYLPMDVCRMVCTRLRARAHAGSTLAANFLIAPSSGSRAHWLRMVTDGVLTLIGEKRRAAFRSGDGEDLFAQAGWRVVRRTAAGRESAKGGYLLLLAGEPA